MQNNETKTKMYDRIRLPKKLRNSRLGFVQSDSNHYPVAKDWFENINYKLNAGDGLLLYGDYGRGKSMLAAVFLKVALAHGHFGMWLDFRDLGGVSSYKLMFDDSTLLLERAKIVPLLIIDEFEQRKNSKGEKSHGETIVEALVREREAQGLSTIVTTNHSPKTLKESGNAGFYAILQNACRPVLVDGPDHRAKG